MKLKRRDTCHFMTREISTCREEINKKREKTGADEVHYKQQVVLFEAHLIQFEGN